MTLTISQMVASSYPAVVVEKNKPANQWAQSSFLAEAQAQGMIETKSLGPTIEAPFDWQANASSAVLGSSDLQTGDLTTKTSVIGTASYSPAQISVWVVWSKGDDVINPAENQKIDFTKALLNNAFESHDNLLETTLFVTSATGGNELLGFDTLIDSTDGTGTIGGVNASTETFWRNKIDGFVNGDDMEAAMEDLWIRTEKGTGASLKPTCLVSDGAMQALFMSTQQGYQRYVDSQALKASFTTAAFKTARYVYSQKAVAGKCYFLNNKSYKIVVSREKYRDKGETQEIQASNGYTFKIYSALQAITNNRSRLGVLKQQ
jgi:hypothetical protein